MPTGRLEIICGPMFAGKTTELIRRVLAARDAGRCAIAIKPSGDHRYHADRILTHDSAARASSPTPGDTSDSLDAIAIAHPPEIESAARAAGADIVAIDEAHFFGAALSGSVANLLAAGTRVIVAGLERDHRGQPFEPFPWLLCEADEIIKLSSRCSSCGGPAIHSQRMIASTDRIVVGGAEAYQPRCRTCFKPGA